MIVNKDEAHKMVIISMSTEEYMQFMGICEMAKNCNIK